MNLILCAINSKYIHSNLAVRSLAAFLGEYAKHITIKEYTVNNDENMITTGLFELNPDVLFFSCYIWNIIMIRSVCRVLRKVLPSVKIVFGGPEASPEDREFVDFVIEGEGEYAFRELVRQFLSGESPHVVQKKLNLDEIPFVYNKQLLDELGNRILYYEASRGCPFNCQYCLSAGDSIRFLSLERVFSDLGFFLETRVKQVKFVDRTFNCDKKRALEIWRFLINNDNGVTNFHFEIVAELLDGECFELLSSVRKGLFQFEIGVQTTNPSVLEVIRRKSNTEKLFTAVALLRPLKIHLHLDLIVGLPGENFVSVQNSFNDLWQLRPDKIQLGFLKVLKNTGFRRDSEKLGLVFRSTPPYEVLFTRSLSFKELIVLKKFEEMLDIFYNSGKFNTSLSFISSFFESGFLFFETLASYWHTHGYHLAAQSKTSVFTMLYSFCGDNGIPLLYIRDLLKFDFLLHENFKGLPPWMNSRPKEQIRKLFPHLSEYSNRQLNACRIETFSLDVTKYINTGILDKRENDILFDRSSGEPTYEEVSLER